MDYQEIIKISLPHSISDVLLAMKAGYHNPRLSTSLKENIIELKWGRNADAQNLVYELADMVDDTHVVGDEIINDLISHATSDKVINNTPHTFEEKWSDDNEEEIW